MSAKTFSFITWLLTSLLLLSYASVLHAANNKRFSFKDGVIYDSKYGLQWAPAPDLSMTHHEAEEYVRNLRLAGGGWRLPTRAELKKIYDKSKPGHADPKFGVDDHLVWTSEVDASNNLQAWHFFFLNGEEGRSFRNWPRLTNRVLAVRFRR